MGYELCISRRNTKGQITADEWSTYVAEHVELVPDPEKGPHFVVCNDVASEWAWLDWFDGEIHSKNPEPALIEKMVDIAQNLGADVLGEEGEVYSPGVEEPKAPSLRLGERIRLRLTRLVPTRQLRIEPPDFAVGDRVVDPWGNTATITGMDAKANHGGGRITTLWDSGETRSYMFFAHGLERLDE